MDQNQWMQLDMGRVLPVAGVVTQGRRVEGYAGPYRGYLQWVTLYRVSVSVNGYSWTAVAGPSGKEMFEGNRDGDSKEARLFSHEVLARYVRINPIEWTGHMTMRAAVVACLQGMAENNNSQVIPLLSFGTCTQKLVLHVHAGMWISF